MVTIFGAAVVRRARTPHDLHSWNSQTRAPCATHFNQGAAIGGIDQKNQPGLLALHASGGWNSRAVPLDHQTQVCRKLAFRGFGFVKLATPLIFSRRRTVFLEEQGPFALQELRSKLELPASKAVFPLPGRLRFAGDAGAASPSGPDGPDRGGRGRRILHIHQSIIRGFQHIVDRAQRLHSPHELRGRPTNFCVGGIARFEEVARRR